MSVVITGATGPFGRHVVDTLLADGFPAEQIVAGGRRVEVLADLPAAVRTVTIDYDRPETLAAAFEGADTVLLVSGSEVGKRVAQHTNVVEAAQAAGVRRVVYTSVLKADTTPLLLAPEHKATEAVIRGSGMAWTFLRNGWYTENYVPAVDEARATGTVVASGGDGRVASASRADFAEAAAVVLRAEGHDGAIYELSGDVAWHRDDLAEAISEIIGKPVVCRSVSPEEHVEMLSGAGLDEGTAGFVVALDGNIREGLLSDTSGDLSRLLGRPTTPLLDGLRAALGEPAATGR